MVFFQWKMWMCEFFKLESFIFWTGDFIYGLTLTSKHHQSSSSEFLINEASDSVSVLGVSGIGSRRVENIFGPQSHLQKSKLQKWEKDWFACARISLSMSYVLIRYSRYWVFSHVIDFKKVVSMLFVIHFATKACINSSQNSWPTASFSRDVIHGKRKRNNQVFLPNPCWLPMDLNLLLLFGLNLPVGKIVLLQCRQHQKVTETIRFELNLTKRSN